MKDNEGFILSGLSAAVLNAELHIDRRPGSKQIDFCPTIAWDEASEEMRNNPKILWFKDKTLLKRHGGEKYTFRSYTDEEKEEIRLNQIYKLEQMFDFILKNYGWQYAKQFYEWDQWRKEFDKYDTVPNLNIPHCKYEKNYQCDIECPFFKGYCTYKEEE